MQYRNSVHQCIGAYTKSLIKNATSLISKVEAQLYFFTQTINRSPFV